MGYLRITLQLMDSLAWPVLALGYPLCASIRAVETGSKYHMRKLVIYWTIFSFLSLFEHVFEKLIEWVPSWPYIKLIAICLLVIPQFNGACYFYENLIHPYLLVKLDSVITQFYGPCYVYQCVLNVCLSVNLQTVTDWFNKPIEDPSPKNETFLDVAEWFLEENGSDSLEKLIANKTVFEASGPVWDDIKVMEHMTENEPAETKQDKSVKKNLIQTEKKTTGGQVKLPETKSSKQVQTEWTCAVCQVTTTSEHDLKCHLRGMRHREKCEELKTYKKTVKLPETESSKKVQTEWTCSVCQVTTTSEHDLKCHLHGMRHREKCEELKTCKKTAKPERNLPCTSNMPDQLKQEQVKHALAAWRNEMQKQVNAGAAPHNLKLWCSLCNIWCPDEIAMAAHLNGRKHMAKIQ